MEVDNELYEPISGQSSSKLDVSIMEWEDNSHSFNDLSRISPLNDIMNQSRFSSQNRSKNFFTGKSQKAASSPLSLLSTLKISDRQKPKQLGLFDDFYCDEDSQAFDADKKPVVEHKTGWFTNGNDTCPHFQTTAVAYKRNWRPLPMQSNTLDISYMEDDSENLPMMETSDHSNSKLINTNCFEENPSVFEGLKDTSKSSCKFSFKFDQRHDNTDKKDHLYKDKKPFSILFKVCTVFLAIISFYGLIQLYLRHIGIETNTAGVCCDFKSLEKSFESDIFGQHLAIKMISDSLKTFHDSNGQMRVLVASMHGSSGTGKTHMAQVMSSFFVKNGFVYFPVAKTFHPDSVDPNIESFKQEIGKIINPSLWSTIQGKNFECPYLVVLDNMEYASNLLVDEVIKVIDHLNEEGPLQRIVFLLISNTGSDVINDNILDAMTQTDFARSEIHSDVLLKSQNFMQSLRNSWMREMLNKEIVNVIVPFLPLEKQHVEMCAMHYLKQKLTSFSHDIMNKILVELDRYYVQPNSTLNALGCKKVLTKIDEIIFSSVL